LTEEKVMKNNEKTNVMRVLDGKKIAYESHSYEPDQTLTGAEIAGILGEDPSRVFKTLVTRGKTGQYYVFVVPVEAELDLKKAAKAAGEKAVDMIKQKELLPLTGYIHGGCSPIGMKKAFTTFIHETAKDSEKIFVSAGKVGCQIELAPADLMSVVRCTLADITA
jgi:Cys-tRNA(Pro)/Cys-tRNA(Cys) deacylase